MSIIKRRKTSHYAQIHNNPLQGGLKDLRAVGLLSHIMSLPETWVLHKTQLQSFYTRKNVDSGWKELVEKNYAIGFTCYKDGKLNYFYTVSDVPFNKDEFEEFVIKQIKELQSEGFSVRSPSSILHSSLVVTEKVTNVLSVQQTDFTDVPKVQHSEYSTEGTYIKKQCIKELLTKKHISSSSHVPAESMDYGFIDQAMRTKFPNAPFDQIKFDLLKDPTVTLETERQYGAMLSYRLNNYTAPVEKKKSTPKKSNGNRKSEVVPEWLKDGKTKARKEKELSAAEINRQRTELLIELGIIEVQA